MNGLSNDELYHSEFVEVDPTGRYGRYDEILGKGSSKIVYRAFDEYEGIEVAWNQVKLHCFLQSSEDLERLYSEIHLLKTLKHRNIMKFYTSWVDIENRNINFVTEMFTSGTLRQYRLKHKRVNIRAVKHWCRQILKGLLHLHSHVPPIVHRDLKCDNIFVNGNQGEVKIGDLGLAAILWKSHAAHCVGTPEFMAPEVYEEAYNELVDIYSFGMCILEMVTLEYPYSECTHPAQIYKKVVSGRKPDAFYNVKDPEVRRFVEKCLTTASCRLSARELLNDPFLQIDDCEYDLSPVDNDEEPPCMSPSPRRPFLELNRGNGTFHDESSSTYSFEGPTEWDYHPVDIKRIRIGHLECLESEDSDDLGLCISGQLIENGGIFLSLRITDEEGQILNIHFPFDLENDTAFSVAMEMVADLGMTDQEARRISCLIDEEVASMVPEWRPVPGIEQKLDLSDTGFCHSCVSDLSTRCSILNSLSKNPAEKNSQILQCYCASLHGRFEEITF